MSVLYGSCRCGVCVYVSHAIVLITGENPFCFALGVIRAAVHLAARPGCRPIGALTSNTSFERLTETHQWLFQVPCWLFSLSLSLSLCVSYIWCDMFLFPPSFWLHMASLYVYTYIIIYIFPLHFRLKLASWACYCLTAYFTLWRVSMITPWAWQNSLLALPRYLLSRPLTIQQRSLRSAATTLCM